jgi:hypothetical protein
MAGGHVWQGEVAAQQRGGAHAGIRAQFESLLRQVDGKQRQGYDVSAVIPYLKLVPGAIRHNRPEVAEQAIAKALSVLGALPAPPAPPSGMARVTVDAAAAGAPIPHLAGNVVVQELYDDPRLERFMREIGPGLIQAKLFLSDLNERRTNYHYLREPGKWKQWIRRIHAAGGRVMLHLRNVPARLTLVPAVNKEAMTGKAPLTEAGEAEWRAIVKEIVAYFNEDLETRVDYVQTIGEPNIHTNWYDPNDVENTRPENAEAFARHFRDTLEAARAADPAVPVGGPPLWFATNDTIWWDGFLGYLSRHKVPLGFVSVHIYDVNYGIWDRGVALVRQKLQQYGFGDRQLIMTEWNLNIDRGSLSKQLKQSHLNAFRLFAKLRDARRLAWSSTDPRLVGIAAGKPDEVLLLLTYYEPLVRDFSDGTFPYREPDWDRTRTVHLRVTELPFDRYAIETYAIDREHSNVHTLGPKGAELERVSLERAGGKTFSREIKLPLYGVQLIRFLKQ